MHGILLVTKCKQNINFANKVSEVVNKGFPPVQISPILLANTLIVLELENDRKKCSKILQYLVFVNLSGGSCTDDLVISWEHG